MQEGASGRKKRRKRRRRWIRGGHGYVFVIILNGAGCTIKICKTQNRIGLLLPIPHPIPPPLTYSSNPTGDGRRRSLTNELSSRIVSSPWCLLPLPLSILLLPSIPLRLPFSILLLLPSLLPLPASNLFLPPPLLLGLISSTGC